MSEPRPNSEQTQRLLELAGTGDPGAFEQLCSEHRPYLRQVVELRMDARLRARVDPSDVVQEAQLEAFRRLVDYLERRPLSFRLWLRKTAYERLLMAQRQHCAARRAVGREAALPDASSVQLADQFLASITSPSQRLARSEVAQQVRRAVALLSELDREVIVLRNLEGLSNQEAAEVLGIEPAAASQRYGRALLRLRKLLIDEGISEGPHERPPHARRSGP